MSKLSADQIKAVAEAATAARNAADAAKSALDADPDDESLQNAYTEAERVATAAHAAAEALSQDDGNTSQAKHIEKVKRRRAILTEELRAVGELEDEDDDDEAESLDKPLTRRDLLDIERKQATRTVTQMAEAIADPLAKRAVTDALARIVPSGDPEKDFADAVAVANREKNSKVLEELSRKGTAARFGSGSGAPAVQKDEAQASELTAEEKEYKRSFGLTDEQIIAAREVPK